MKIKSGITVFCVTLMLSLLFIFTSFCVSAAEENSGVAYTSEQAAAAAVRAYLVGRVETFSIPVKLDLGTNIEAMSEGERSDTIKALPERIKVLAFEETDKGYEGDYLDMVKGYSAVMPDYSVKGSVVSGTISYDITLMTTAGQEKQVNEKVKQILGSLALDSKTDYHKIKAIYDYICTHVTYDDEMKDPDLSCTAYAALIDGKAICQGYAAAVYRLMKEAGIGCRVIYGNHKTDEALNHVWNIVELDGKYYYVDATGDATSYAKKQDYDYFLKGRDSYKQDKHGEYDLQNDTAEFWAKYPLSATDFPYKEQEPASEPGGKDDPEKIQPMTVKAKSPSVTFSKTKKRTIARTKAFTIKNAKGAVTFKKLGGSKKLMISKAGKITVRPGTKKGSYKIRVAVTAEGNVYYKAGTRKVTVTVKVK